MMPPTFRMGLLHLTLSGIPSEVDPQVCFHGDSISGQVDSGG